MLDPRLVKEHPEVVQDLLRKRNISNFPFEDLVKLDARRRELIVKDQELRQRKNKLSELIAQAKKNKTSAETELSEMKSVGSGMNDVENELQSVQASYMRLAMMLPNLLDSTVPLGPDETHNRVIKKVGEVPKFDFVPKDHVDIAANLKIVDLERAAKISGARFYILKNELVKLNQALINLALDFLSKRDYELVQPPFMIRKDPMQGAVILGDFEDVIYKIDSEDLYLIGTSEHAIASMHMNEILDGKKLPIRYAGFSPCFRKEAGAHGKDMKGIFRVHQFEKVEQFVYTHPSKSQEEQERMLLLSEEFFQLLELPYRVVLLSSGDTGKISSKTYDIEVWMPGQQSYREVVSCSNCIDFQSRRLGIRFRDKSNEETQLVHTLNSTLVATERTMVAIMENFQRSDGTVSIPNALRPFAGFDSLSAP